MTSVEFTAALVKNWVSRREAMGLKPKTITHAKAQLEFFLGAYEAAILLGQPVNTGCLILLTVGRDALELLPKETA